MDNRRLFLLIALGVVCYMIFNAWMADYGLTQHVPSQTAGTTTQGNHAPTPGTISAPEAPAAPNATQPTATNNTAPITTPRGGAPRLAHGQNITVTTDTMQVTLDTAGGTIRHVELLQYGQTEKPDSPPVNLLTPQAKGRLVLQTGLRGLATANTPVMYKSQATTFALRAGQDELKVPLTWRGSDGVRVTKIYTFHRGKYVVGLDYHVTNAGGQPIEVTPYARFLNHYVPQSTSFFSISRYTYTGPATFDGDDYEKHSYKDLDDKPFSITATGGWIAMVNQYFLAAVLPPAKQPAHYYARHMGNKRYQSGLVLPTQTVAAGANIDIAQRVLLGPKLQDRLGDIAPGLPRTVDYGKVTIIAQPMYKILEGIHYVVGNWGWSILLLVFLMKLVFFPLFQKSGRSMAKMREFQPRIKAIQKRYKEDRQRQSQAMMELYKTEKINPIGGCLPMLLYFPIYFGLYYVLIYSVELRHAPFIFWMTDLSSPDPYHILPFIYGIANFAQMHVNPKPADKMQARLMMLMPLGVIAFSFIMPVGLVLYWIANAVLTTLQQWHINRLLHQQKGQKR